MNIPLLFFFFSNLSKEFELHALLTKEEAVCQWLCFKSQITTCFPITQNIRTCIEGNKVYKNILPAFHLYICINFFFQIYFPKYLVSSHLYFYVFILLIIIYI